MTIEHSHGKARPTLPRSSDLAVPETVGEPPDERGERGRFASGNQLAKGHGWKKLLRESLGRELEGDAGKLGQEAFKLYRGFMADMPIDNASVRQLVVARARAATLSARYARRGAELGFDTSEARDALDAALRWSQEAKSLAVTSLDIATKLAAAGGRKVIDAHARVLTTFGRKKP